MSDDRIILCIECGQQNRLESGKAHPHAVCGYCGEQLFPPGAPRIPRKRNNTELWLWLGFVTLGIVAAFTISVFYDPPSEEAERADIPPRFNPPVAQFDEPPVPISTGLVRTHPRKERVAPFEVRTPSDGNYFVKLIDTLNQQEILAMYIEGGETFETKVPLGIFEMRYAVGDTWYGESHLFGPSTGYFRADEDFRFYEDSVTYYGHTVELIKQVGGNLGTDPIPPSEF